ncbi:SLC23A2 [Bugula neritina]|uniref:SLC23A2 n=1 Tax=Bugula neritina TaxID=10212 RepID=A0A7J7JAN6_BUGNE|nr:SLC23A2 [Bugula neritina]KAF6040412.1 SLC23A2 [Bugula neritina]
MSGPEQLSSIEESSKHLSGDVEASQVTGEPASSGQVEEETEKTFSHLQYAIEDVPPWYLSAVLGFQHYLSMAGGAIAVPLLVAVPICIEVGLETDEVAKAELIATAFFVSGIVTFIQATFGCRLPIVQGGSAAFYPPLLAIFRTFDKCPLVLSEGSNLTEFYIMNPNSTEPVVINGSEEHREVWRARMRAAQGALLVASVFEIIIGLSGILGVMLKYIGPLVISVTITLVGISLAELATNAASIQWGISILTFALILIFSQYMAKVKVPAYFKGHWSRSMGYPIFQLFAVMLAMLTAYIVSIIFTYTNVFPDDKGHIYYKARTDGKISVITNANWFRVPYPGQWGAPTVSISGVFGILAAILASVIESVGDYYAAARISGAPPPTREAINRGIAIEGLGCTLAGAFGAGPGTTSYSGNIGALAITQVGSRRVIQVAAAFMLISGVLTKLCAVFVTIPDPVLGGAYLTVFGLIISVGLSNLQYVDLNSSRNLYIVGTSLMFGIGVPIWLKDNKNLINTGNDVIDEIFQVLLSTSMFVGGGLAFFLDNTIPGTAKERGMSTWLLKDNSNTSTSKEAKISTYDMPFGNEAIYRSKWTSYIPICPNFLSHRHNLASPKELTDSKEKMDKKSSITSIDQTHF